MTANKYYFLCWQFDCEQDTITHVDTLASHKLEPQLSRLLLLLIENRETVFSKEQLSNILWPNTIVEENSVYQVLTKLRKLLDDPPKQAKIIKTFPKKGYRFIAELLPVAGENKPVSASNQEKKSRYRRPLLMVVFLLIGFSAIAFFSINKKTAIISHYASIEITTDLGLESWPAAHPQDESILYVKDEHQLWHKKKDMSATMLINSPERLFYPAWSEDAQRIALWHFNDDSCVLVIHDLTGQAEKTSRVNECDYVGRLIWLNEQKLVALYRQEGQYKAFQYHLSTGKFIEIPLLLNPGERLKTAVKAWHDAIFYVVINRDYSSRLMDNEGRTIMQWPHPVKFAAFDHKQQRLIVNDKSKHLGLTSIGLAGDKQHIAQTGQGIFSAVSTDQQGRLYATVENWQVNIRDKDNLPIFSSTSLDYLPVSNALGETAFMSRRGGFCQIYLHSNEKVEQLSHFNNYDTVKFVQWSPDLSLILTNRDNSAYIYNRKGLIQSFALITNNLPISFGWLSNEKIYSFDGNYLRYYAVTGEKVAEFKVNADYLYYQLDVKKWWLFEDKQLYSVAGELLNREHSEQLQQLSAEQASRVSGIRIVADQLYWKSRFGQQDHIWQYDTKHKQAPQLVKSGKFIWNYDVNANNELSIAVKENIEGNIRLYRN